MAVSVCAGRPTDCLEPCPTSSTALASPSAHCTALSTSLASRGCRITSESREVGKCHSPGVHVHAAELGTAVVRRKNLAGIEQALVVEGALESLLLIEIGLREHRRHQVAL